MKHFDFVEDYFSSLKIDPGLANSVSSNSENMERRLHPPRSKSLGPDERECMKSVLRGLASPRTKKAVHFADHDGLALVNVHNFIPSSDDLDALDSAAKKRNLFWRSNSNDSSTGKNCYSTLLDIHGLVLGFAQPSLDPAFADKLVLRNVCLESASLNGRSVSGIVKVCNLAFEKTVAVRFTHDTWQSFSETLCNYIPDSSDGKTDKFTFKIDLPKRHKTVQFALRYSVCGREYWDNNEGKNYIIFSTG